MQSSGVKFSLKCNHQNNRTNLIAICLDGNCQIDRFTCSKCFRDHNNHIKNVISFLEMEEISKNFQIIDTMEIPESAEKMILELITNKEIELNDKIQQLKEKITDQVSKQENLFINHQKLDNIKNQIQDIQKVMKAINKQQDDKAFKQAQEQIQSLIKQWNNIQEISSYNDIIIQFEQGYYDYNEINIKTSQAFQRINQNLQQIEELLSQEVTSDSMIQQIDSQVKNIGTIDFETLLTQNSQKFLKRIEKLQEQSFKQIYNREEEFLKQLSQNIINQTQAAFGDFTLLMKLTGDTLCYSNDCWTTEKLLNEKSIDISEKTPAKYPAFNTLKVKEILVLNDQGRFSLLSLTQPNKSLLEIFKGNQYQNLNVTLGCASPCELITGNKQYPNYAPNWRLNCFRIGGFYHHSWGQYGSDQLGSACAAEMAGIGIEDNIWGSFTHAKKSYGIRAAHDSPTTPDGQNLGQFSGFALLFGR